MSQDLTVVAIMVAKPDKVEELRSLLVPAVEAFRNEEGCTAYSLHEDIKQRGRFVTYESWRDEDALKAHMKAPTLTDAEPKLEKILESEMEQYLLGTILKL